MTTFVFDASTNFLDHGGTPGIRDLSCGGAIGLTARALAVVAEGGHPDVAKPLRGLGSGVLELALSRRCVSRHLCGPARCGRLGAPRLSEEIEDRHQDPAGR